MQSSANKQLDVAKSGLTPWKLIQTYSAAEWEEFIAEWSEGFDPPYHTIVRLGGAGDKGRDVVCYLDDPQSDCEWDNYQCKHYDRALRPTDIYVELGKLCVYTQRGDFSVPRRYRFVSPCGVGTKLHDLLKKPTELRKELFANWADYCEKKISDAEAFPLTIELRDYIEKFDFKRVWFVTPQQLLAQHEKTKYWHRRFKLDPPERPPVPAPPAAVEKRERKYVAALLGAYSEHAGKTVKTVAELALLPELDEHFRRARGYFFSAEALARFSRDHFKPGAFAGVKKDIYDGVVDITLGAHADGFACVLATTSAAIALPLPQTDLHPYVGPADKIGVCHHLANDGELKWCKKK